MQKKYIALFLMVCLIITSISFGNNSYDNENTTSFLEQDWRAYKRTNGLPSDTPTHSEKGFIFNEEIWDDLGLIVYGDYTLVNPNDFKDSTLNESGLGYYEKNGLRGEYRYHGVDRNDNNVGNDNFPRDASSNTALENKRWVYSPWNDDGNNFALNSYRKHVGVANPWMNVEAIQGNTTLAQQISDGMKENFNIKNATYDGSNNISDSPINGKTDPMYYTAIQSPPTSVGSGQGIMFHRSKFGDSSSGAWYQTFPIAKVTTKQRTPVQATISNISEPNIKLNGDVSIDVEITGVLKDEHLFVGGQAEQINLQTNYNRKDIALYEPWLMTLENSINGELLTLSGQGISPNSGLAKFTVSLTQEEYASQLDEENNFEINFDGSALVNFYTGDTEIGFTNGLKSASGIALEEEEPLKEHVEFEVSAPKEILDVWNFPVSVTEINITELQYKYVVLNGQILNESDKNRFLNGIYKFPEIKKDKIYDYKIVYVDKDNEESFYQSFVLVYDSIPRASVRVEQDSGKVNRKIGVSADETITPLFLRNNSSVSISSFTVTSQEGHTVYYGTNTSALKEFLLKETGVVTVTAIVSNQYGSRSYSHDIYVGQDHVPDITAIIWNNNLARGDELDIHAVGSSLDGDTVTGISYEIYYDENQDENPEKLVDSGLWDGTMDYSPDKLGMYEIHFKTTESFGEATIEAHVTASDRRSVTVVREFFVENLLPMTKIYTDIEYNFPILDVVFLIDEVYPPTDVNFIKNNAVDTRNNFRANSMVANVDTWDLKTYVHNQTAYKRVHSGSSYPSSSISYSNGGYSGTLSRTNVDNYQYQQDHGSWTNKTVSRTETDSRSASGTSPPGVSRDAAGVPTSLSYSSGGYSGTLYETSYSYDTEPVIEDGVASSWKFHWSRSATYSGTVSGTTSVWQSDWRWHNNYYGDYSGTVYSYIKQQYTPEYDVVSNKYIVYFAKDGVNNIADLNKVKDVARDAHLILIGDPSIKGQVGESTFIGYTSHTQNIIDEIVNTIKGENKIINEKALLPNEIFTMNFTDTDAENDKLIYENTMLYVHDPNHFDNPTGQENSTFLQYNETNFSDVIKNSFSNVGKFTIYRRISDEPTEDPTKGLYSNIASIDIYIHRRPIADYELDWTYDSNLNVYETTWLDQSYDLDFQYSDPINKGIVNRKIKYRRNGGSWIYEIPQNLISGTYDLEYIVQDNFGVWSDVKSQTFVLEDAPGIQLLTAKLKTLKSEFSLSGIPHTEALLLYDVVTRYPYEHEGYLRWYKNNSPVSEEIPLGSSYEIEGSDRLYNPFMLQIDKKIANDNYSLRLIFKSLDGTKESYKDFQVVVATPIDLTGSMPETFYKGDLEFHGTSSIYVDRVELLAFIGTSLERSFNLTSSEVEQWSGVLNVEEEIEPGLYDFEYTAWVDAVPAFNESIILNSEKKALNVASITLDGDWSYYERDENLFNEPLLYDGHRFLSLERLRLEVKTLGSPDQVVLTLPDEFIQEIYTNSKGQSYDNTEWIDLRPKSFSLTQSDENTFYTSFDLAIVDSSLSKDNVRLRPSYELLLTLVKSSDRFEYLIDDVEVTGNVFDHIYLQPKTDQNMD